MSTNKKINLKELDLNSIGSWPRQAQMIFCVLVALVILGLGWWLFVRDKRTELEGLQGQETELRTEFETKQGRAANLEPLKQQLAQMEQQLEQQQGYEEPAEGSDWGQPTPDAAPEDSHPEGDKPADAAPAGPEASYGADDPMKAMQDALGRK